jgi:type VI protein secretion system component VasK
MTNAVPNLVPLLDHAASQSDRWLFIAALALLLVFTWLVIRWLVNRTDLQNEALLQIAEQQNETAQHLAVVIAQNTEVINDCKTELKLARAAKL